MKRGKIAGQRVTTFYLHVVFFFFLTFSFAIYKWNGCTSSPFNSTHMYYELLLQAGHKNIKCQVQQKKNRMFEQKNNKIMTKEIKKRTNHLQWAQIVSFTQMKSWNAAQKDDKSKTTQSSKKKNRLHTNPALIFTLWFKEYFCWKLKWLRCYFFFLQLLSFFFLCLVIIAVAIDIYRWSTKRRYVIELYLTFTANVAVVAAFFCMFFF